MQVQLEAWREARRSGTRRIGWKVAAPDERLFSRGLLSAYVSSDTVVGAGGTYGVGADVALHAQATLALQVGAHEQITGYAAALELVELGDQPGTRRGMLPADLGDRAITFGPRRPRLSAVDGRLLVNGHVRGGAFLEGGYAELLTRLPEVLSAKGESLLRGDRVITGPIARVPVWPGDHVVADLGPLGNASLVIA